MSVKGLVVAIWAVCVGVGAAQAQPSALSDPAELPPKSFTGQQYVDSRGCVFLRAGLGGTVTWVPRVTAERKQMCRRPAGAVDTASAPAAVAVEEVAAVTPVKPAVKAAPVQKKKVRKVAPAPASPPGMRMACPVGAPYLEQLRGPSGDSKLYCTRGDGTVDGAALPRLIHAGTVVGQVSGVTIVPGAAAAPPVPKGYVRAWKDDRLNPHRAVGTAEGMAAQDRVWTRDVPQKAAVTPVVPVVAATGHYFVQVGSFGVAANAEGAAGRLGAMGLPVSRASAKLGGKPVRVIYAGPFGTTVEAQAALSAVRRAGFADAFIRR